MNTHTILTGLSLLACTVAAGPAYAQEADLPFSGPYIGVSGGYDVQGSDIGSIIKFDRNGDGNFSDAVTTSTGANAFSPGFCKGKARGATPDQTCETDRNKGSYYVRAGYDIQRGNWVVGAVGEFGKTRITDFVSAFSTTPASYTLSRSVKWEGSARLRAGYSIGGGLFYATGGAGYVRLNHGFTTTNGANQFTTLVDDRDRPGFIVGGGVEYRISGPFTIGLEYTYHNYKDKDYKVFATRGTAAATNPFVLAPFTAGTVLTRSDDNFRWNSLRATATFRF